MSQLTCNQVMLLLDIYRGTYSPDRHLGTLNTDLNLLENVNVRMIQNDTHQGDSHSDYSLTDKGQGLAEHILQEATWKSVVVYGGDPE